MGYARLRKTRETWEAWNVETLDALRALIVRHANGAMGKEVLSGVAVGMTTAPSFPFHGIYQPVFVIVAQGSKRIVLGDTTIDAVANDCMVVPLDLPVSSHITEASEEHPYLAAVLVLNPALVATLLLEAGSAGNDPEESAPIGVSKATPELIDACVRLLRLADCPADIPILRPMIEREIIWRLLSGDQRSLVRQIGLADGRLAKIGSAVRWIRDHYADTLRIEDLAKRVAMSPTSFHRHFRAATATSPLQYQKLIRLQEARSRLVANGDDIASVGFSVGYGSPSQFSREYARFFGAPPSRDAAALRAALS